MSTYLQAEWDGRQVFEGELLADEQILWHGQPDPTRMFSKSDILLLPFSLFWGGFAVFWEYMAAGEVLKNGIKHPMDLLFPLFGLPFILFGLYFIFGRFIYKRWKRHRTYYAVTDKRILIKPAKGSVQTLFINTLPGVNKVVGSDGVGTVVFGDMPSVYMLDDTGMGSVGQRGTQNVNAFYDIKDADSVYQMVNKLRSESTPS